MDVERRVTYCAKPQRPLADLVMVHQACQLITRAKRPLVVVGKGIYALLQIIFRKIQIRVYNLILLCLLPDLSFFSHLALQRLPYRNQIFIEI